MSQAAKPLEGRRTPITLKDDAYQFPLYQDWENVFWYGEYWYFNFKDPISGWSGIIGFTVFNPKDVGFLGASALLVTLFGPRGQVLYEMDFHPLGEFWASTREANVTIGQNVVRPLDEARYAVQLATRDGRVSLDLVFERADESFWFTHDIRGEQPWEVNSWLVYMPSARVQGTLTVDGQTSTFTNGLGYHDHSWGIWKIPSRMWAWAMFANPGKELNCDLGYKTGFAESEGYFRYKDLRLHFRTEGLTWTWEDWKRWESLWQYPGRARAVGMDETGRYRLDVTWTVESNAAIWKSPILIFEQSSRFEGTLSTLDPDGNGDWTVITTFAEQGHSEWVIPWNSAF
ncbi:hypothetical protein [Corallococcus sp. M7]